MSTSSWRPIEGFSGSYEAHSDGLIRSTTSSYETTFRGRRLTRTKKARLLSGQKLSSKGYRRVNLLGTVYFVHRIIAKVFLKNPNGYLQINHKNGNKTDNRVENLEWVSNAQNRAHACENNLIAFGVRISGAKLNDAAVREIRRLHKTELWEQKDISVRFNISQQTVSQIVRGHTWKRVKD